MERERSRVRVVNMDNLRVFLVIRRMDRVSNPWIRELCGVKKGLLDSPVQPATLKGFHCGPFS